MPATFPPPWVEVKYRPGHALGVAAGIVRLALAPVKALLADTLEEDLIRSNPSAGVLMTEKGQQHRSTSTTRTRITSTR